MDPQSAVELNDRNQMPKLGFGTEGLTGDTAVTAVKAALKTGFRLIDTSSHFFNEAEVAEGMRQSEVPRADIYLVAKIVPDNAGMTRRVVEERCELLGVEYVDLCLLQHPPDTGAGSDVWEELVDTRRAGMCKSIGVCDYSFRKAAQLYDLTGVMPAVNQVEVSPFGYPRQLITECQDAGVVVQACSPLTNGNLLQDETLKEISTKHGKKASQILIRWSMQKNLVPLPKSSKHEHIQENYDVFNFELSDDDLDTLDNLNENYNSRS